MTGEPNHHLVSIIIHCTHELERHRSVDGHPVGIGVRVYEHNTSTSDYKISLRRFEQSGSDGREKWNTDACEFD